MMLNPMLLVRSREILARYKPVIADLASGREITLRRADLDEIEAFLAAFGDRSSPELREAIREACRDLRDPEVQSDLRFRVVN
jgi:hypothetical protein